MHFLCRTTLILYIETKNELDILETNNEESESPTREDQSLDLHNGFVHSQNPRLNTLFDRLGLQRPGKCNMLPRQRVYCGFPGITRRTCWSRGCCFDDSIPGLNQCYHERIGQRFTFGGKTIALKYHES